MSRALLLLLAYTGWSAWIAKPEVDAVRVRVGETVQVRVDAYYVPAGGSGFRPITFTSSNPRFVEVTGKMPAPARTTMHITGMRPGQAQALLVTSDSSRLGSVDVTIVCGREPSIQIAAPQQTARIGEPVLLRAETPIAERTTFTWYRGRIGDMSAPIAASGPELEFASSEPGLHHAWVMATTPCSSSSAQFEVDVTAPRRRSARH